MKYVVTITQPKPRQMGARNFFWRTWVNELLSEHFQTTTVANGDEALQKLHEKSFDLIISDVKMPGLDGIALYGTWKARLETTAKGSSTPPESPLSV